MFPLLTCPAAPSGTTVLCTASRLVPCWGVAPTRTCPACATWPWSCASCAATRWVWLQLLCWVVGFKSLQAWSSTLTPRLGMASPMLPLCPAACLACSYQFLCDGLEDDMTLKWQAQDAAAAEGKTQKEREVEKYTRASGKMLLLHKLLPKLRAEGRQVRTTCVLQGCFSCWDVSIVAAAFPSETLPPQASCLQWSSPGIVLLVRQHTLLWLLCRGCCCCYCWPHTRC